MHGTTGLGQCAGLCDAWPGPSSSGVCSASLHGLLQPGALTLLTGIFCAAMLFYLYAALFYLFHLTSNTILAYSWSETTHEAGIRQDDRVQSLSALTSFTY